MPEEQDVGKNPQGHVGGAGAAGGPKRRAEEDPLPEDERGAGAPLDGKRKEGRERRTEQHLCQERY